MQRRKQDDVNVYPINGKQACELPESWWSSSFMDTSDFRGVINPFPVSWLADHNKRKTHITTRHCRHIHLRGEVLCSARRSRDRRCALPPFQTAARASPSAVIIAVQVTPPRPLPVTLPASLLMHRRSRIAALRHRRACASPPAHLPATLPRPCAASPFAVARRCLRHRRPGASCLRIAAFRCLRFAPARAPPRTPLSFKFAARFNHLRVIQIVTKASCIEVVIIIITIIAQPQPVAMTERDKSRYTEGSVIIGGSAELTCLNLNSKLISQIELLFLSNDSARAGDELRELVVKTGMSVKNVSKALATSVSSFKSNQKIYRCKARAAARDGTEMSRLDRRTSTTTEYGREVAASAIGFHSVNQTTLLIMGLKVEVVSQLARRAEDNLATGSFVPYVLLLMSK
ncbi:hypothetical protein EVAR_9978_1 [Eumeta japonica]|uniref:Uncharacterized protein n=1 Tax=Eumeta variegata TaxID=151549 RepID=A0A4C1TR58_EUMVA|nr:hypothetical protein EVAR_9978_1 [Eumeta japonica]